MPISPTPRYVCCYSFFYFCSYFIVFFLPQNVPLYFQHRWRFTLNRFILPLHHHYLSMCHDDYINFPARYEVVSRFALRCNRTCAINGIVERQNNIRFVFPFSISYSSLQNFNTTSQVPFYLSINGFCSVSSIVSMYVTSCYAKHGSSEIQIPRSHFYSYLFVMPVNS